jgi:hypothetical protein
MPQLPLSDARLRQTPEQLVVPAAQVTLHVPPEHTVPAAQTRAQAPQLLLSVWRSRQTPEQLVVPAPHDTEHVLLEQS